MHLARLAMLVDTIESDIALVHESIDKVFGDGELASLLPMGEELVDFQRNVKSYKRAKLTCPRWSIKPHHLRQLEEIFKEVQAPSLALRQAVAEQMGVTPRQVQVWFRNRRQRVRLSKLGKDGCDDDDDDDDTICVNAEPVAPGAGAQGLLASSNPLEQAQRQAQEQQALATAAARYGNMMSNSQHVNSLYAQNPLATLLGQSAAGGPVVDASSGVLSDMAQSLQQRKKRRPASPLSDRLSEYSGSETQSVRSSGYSTAVEVDAAATATATATAISSEVTHNASPYADAMTESRYATRGPGGHAAFDYAHPTCTKPLAADAKGPEQGFDERGRPLGLRGLGWDATATPAPVDGAAAYPYSTSNAVSFQTHEAPGSLEASMHGSMHANRLNNSMHGASTPVMELKQLISQAVMCDDYEAVAELTSKMKAAQAAEKAAAAAAPAAASAPAFHVVSGGPTMAPPQQHQQAQENQMRTEAALRNDSLLNEAFCVGPALSAPGGGAHASALGAGAFGSFPPAPAAQRPTEEPTFVPVGGRPLKYPAPGPPADGSGMPGQAPLMMVDGLSQGLYDPAMMMSNMGGMPNAQSLMLMMQLQLQNRLFAGLGTKSFGPLGQQYGLVDPLGQVAYQRMAQPPNGQMGHGGPPMAPMMNQMMSQTGQAGGVMGHMMGHNQQAMSHGQGQPAMTGQVAMPPPGMTQGLHTPNMAPPARAAAMPAEHLPPSCAAAAPEQLPPPSPALTSANGGVIHAGIDSSELFNFDELLADN